MTYPPQWNPPPEDPFNNYQEPLTYPSGYTPQPQQGWPEYSGYPGYSGYEAPPLGGPPPPKNRLPLILSTIAGVVIVALVLGVVMWRLNSRDDNHTVADSTTTSMSASATTSTTATTSASTPTSTTATPACSGHVAPQNPRTPAGWIPVDSPRGLTYSVPGDWTVNSCTTLVGWEKKCPDGPFGYCPIRTMSGSAEMPNKECADGSRALTGVPGAKSTPDINEAVQQESQLVADIYTSDSGVVPQVSLSPPKNLTIGGAPAVQIVATVTGIAADNCTGPSALHSMLATTVPGLEGSVLFVISLEQGYPGAPDPGLIDQLVGTLDRQSA